MVLERLAAELGDLGRRDVAEHGAAALHVPEMLLGEPGREALEDEHLVARRVRASVGIRGVKARGVSLDRRRVEIAQFGPAERPVEVPEVGLVVLERPFACTRERLVPDEVGNEWTEGIAGASHLKLDALLAVLSFQSSARHACRPFPWDGRTGERTLQPRRAVTTVEVAEPCDGHDDDAASHPVHDSS